MEQPSFERENNLASEEAIETTKEFPTKNLLVFGEDRKVTSMWLSESIHKAFIDACKLTGRKTCDVIEPFERSYVEVVKKAIIKEKVESCLFRPLIINLKLTVQEKYEKRGPKTFKKLDKAVYCQRANNYVEKFYCLNNCRFGRNHQKYGNVPCEVYLGLE